jgi:hypothetical protein
MSKYTALTKHLSSRSGSRLPMSFAEVETILGFPLPASARSHRPWWANSAHGHVQSRGWLDAGYQSEQVDLEGEKLVFVRLNEVDAPACDGGSLRGDHPLFGCMAGMITVPEGIDLTEPGFTDTEVETLFERSADLLREGKP